MCVYCVYLLCVYIDTHTSMYILNKKCMLILNNHMQYKLYSYKCIFFLNMYYMGVYLCKKTLSLYHIYIQYIYSVL